MIISSGCAGREADGSVGGGVRQAARPLGDLCDVQCFRGGLVFEAHGLYASLTSRLESNQEEKKKCGVGLHSQAIPNPHP